MTPLRRRFIDDLKLRSDTIPIATARGGLTQRVVSKANISPLQGYRRMHRCRYNPKRSVRGQGDYELRISKKTAGTALRLLPACGDS
jgi:hypothetical protein